METITVFRTENGETVKKVWIIGDNKESENEKATIKDIKRENETYYKIIEKAIGCLYKDDFTKLKEKCMQDKEFKKEYDKLQPEYDKIKEDIQKEINKEKPKSDNFFLRSSEQKSKNVIVDTWKDLSDLIGRPTERRLHFDIDITNSMISFYVRSSGENTRIILQDVMRGFEDPNKYLFNLVGTLYLLGFNVELSKRLKIKEKEEVEKCMAHE